MNADDILHFLRAQTISSDVSDESKDFHGVSLVKIAIVYR